MFLPFDEVSNRCGLSRRAVDFYVREGLFPAPRKVGRRVLWLESEVSAWTRETLARRDAYVGGLTP